MGNASGPSGKNLPGVWYGQRCNKVLDSTGMKSVVRRVGSPTISLQTGALVPLEDYSNPLICIPLVKATPATFQSSTHLE